MVGKKTNCVIFDCEGTLVDSERLCCEALVQVFNEIGAELSIEDIIDNFEGGKIADIMHSTLQLAEKTADIDVLEQRYREVLEPLFLKKLTPMRGAIELLDWLRETETEFCVTSNAPKDRIESILKSAGLCHYFQGKIFSAFEANSWKPEPDLIRYCAMNMGFMLDECVYVDDTHKGVKAGLNAGVTTFQITPLTWQNRVSHPKVTVLESLEQLTLYLI